MATDQPHPFFEALGKRRYELALAGASLERGWLLMPKALYVDLLADAWDRGDIFPTHDELWRRRRIMGFDIVLSDRLQEWHAGDGTAPGPETAVEVREEFRRCSRRLEVGPPLDEGP